MKHWSQECMKVGLTWWKHRSDFLDPNCMSSAFLHLCFLLLQALSFSLPASEHLSALRFFSLALSVCNYLSLICRSHLLFHVPTSSVRGPDLGIRLQRAEGHVGFTPRIERWRKGLHGIRRRLYRQ